MRSSSDISASMSASDLAAGVNGSDMGAGVGIDTGGIGSVFSTGVGAGVGVGVVGSVGEALVLDIKVGGGVDGGCGSGAGGCGDFSDGDVSFEGGSVACCDAGGACGLTCCRLASQSSRKDEPPPDDDCGVGDAGGGDIGLGVPGAPAIGCAALPGTGTDELRMASSRLFLSSSRAISAACRRLVISASTIARGRPYLAAESRFSASDNCGFGCPIDGIQSIENGADGTLLISTCATEV